MWTLLFVSLEDRKTTRTAGTAGSCSHVAGEIVGRTVPSFRIALAQEEGEWKEYRQHLGKKQRRAFDEMFSIVRLYISSCSNTVVPVRIHVIVVTILFHHYLDLFQIMKELGLEVHAEQ